VTEPSETVELVALAVREGAVRCGFPGAPGTITLRAGGTYWLVPGHLLTVGVAKRWSHRGHPYLSGEILGTRLDVAALGLEPLGLEHFGQWDPAEHYWGEEGEPLEDWARPIHDHGPRPQYEMEQVLPGESIESTFDLVLEANELSRAGDEPGARRILMDLLLADLRCLDAHAHLSMQAFDLTPRQSLAHAEVGVRIGELSLPPGFDGVLPWGLIDNRPFLRCLHSQGLGLWRAGRQAEAAAVFESMLWLNPTDNQGVRALLPAARSGEDWESWEE
jgi:hypothetical protein